jgi:cystathionine gamma-synthase
LDGWDVSEQPGFETRAIHAGQDPDPSTGAVVPPIHMATTFAQHEPGKAEFEYSRSDNPTRKVFEAAVASLEGARHGFAFASGMAAEDALLRALRPGDHLVVPNDAYGGTWRLVDKVYGPMGVTHTAVDLSDLDAVAAAWTDATKLVWVETPSNPLLSIADIGALAELAHGRGGRCVVDNTFATPFLQQPLALGADAVVHSTTKYLGGHSDVVGGFVAVNDDAWAEQLFFIRNATGAVSSPFNDWLVLRGLKTLAVRMERHCRSAHDVAQLLVRHPRVTEVRWPGLATHPGYEVARAQMVDFGGMVSFVVDGGAEAAAEVVARTNVFTLAESLGAVESLIEQPAVMTHLSVAGSDLDVDPALIRLSVGLETIDDLLADLDQALAG